MLSPVSVMLVWRRRVVCSGLTIVGIFLIVACFGAYNTSVQIPEPSSQSENAEFWRPPKRLKPVGLGIGVVFLTWTAIGRWLFRATRPKRTDQSLPAIAPGIARTLDRPDGSRLHVETRGSAAKPTIILVHGWSLNSNQWAYSLPEWQDHFHLVAWDLAGLGKSTQPSNRDYSVEKMAHDLRAVVETSGATQVVLLGHSIGGMVILTFCRLFPELLGSVVAKLVLVHTTYTNPLRTMGRGDRFLRWQKSVIEPLLHAQIALWPLVWLMDRLSYWNGSLHLTAQKTGFSGTEAYRPVDFVARFYAQDSPAVLARGALAMLAFDEIDTLKTIKIPVLVIAGEDDPLTEVQASQKIAADIAPARLIVLSAAKHMGLIEYHKDFSRHVTDFCSPLPGWSNDEQSQD